MYKTPYNKSNLPWWLRAPNRLIGSKENGRIGYTKKMGGAFLVSPFNSEFETQVEKNIYPVVKEANEKGYFTISSCQGHGEMHPHVYFALKSKKDYDYLYEEFNKLWGIKVRPHEKLKNRVMNVSYDETKDELIVVESQAETERCVEDLNKMFMCNAKKYYYLGLHMHGTLFERLFKSQKEKSIKKVLMKLKNLKSSWDL